MRITHIVFAGLATLSLLLVFASSPVSAQVDRVFTADELAEYNGTGGQPAYFAYEGVVYDVTGSPFWEQGQHYGLQAGTDLTGQMAGAPHGEEVLTSQTVVGRYAAPAASPTATGTLTPENTRTEELVGERKWYEGRIRIAGFSLLGWTGILLGISFVLNFATCFALPWTKLPLPWHGKRPGPDPLDAAQTRPRWGNLHRYFAWSTIIFGILHGVLGLMQLMGYYV